MSPEASPDLPVRALRPRREIWPELRHGFDNLRAHKLRSLLTMLGMIFGVAAVIATHNMELARHMDRVVTLRDGHLEAQRF